MIYKGYKIRESSGIGRAGRFSKTFSIQVSLPINGGYLLKKNFANIPKGNQVRKAEAIEKAKTYIDSIT